MLHKSCTQKYGGPQVQYKNFNLPVQTNKYQHKNIYFSAKVFTSVQKYLFQYQKIYFNPKIFISVPKYIFQSKNIYFSTKKSFPKSINMSQVSLRPAGRKEVSHQNGGFEWLFKTKQPLIILRNYKYETILAFLERFHDIRTSISEFSCSSISDGSIPKSLILAFYY